MTRPPARRSRRRRGRTRLDGRTVALLDISKNRGAEFLDRLEQHLRGLGAEVERFGKPLFSRPATTDLVDRIAGRAEVAVEALAD